MARKLDIGAMLGDTVSKLNTMQVREIALSQLEENPDNSYAQTGIDELAESIQVIGLQQPLVVVPVEDGRFRILAGHRRRNALEKLERKTAPCVVLDADLDPSLRVLILHWTNTMARGGAGLTAENTFAAAKEIKEALLDLKQRGVIELPGKLRAYVADVLKVSQSAIARADTINKHLSKAWKGDYKCQRINDSVAYELSQCDDKLQRDLHDLYKGNVWLLDAKDVKAHKKAAAAGFAPLKCPKEPYYCIEPCVVTDKRAAAVKRGECPGCCHDCDKADGCEWVCGRVSKAHRAHAEAEEREEKRKQETEAFEASPLGKLRRRLRETLAEYGVHSYRDLSHVVYNNWIWTDDPTAYHSIYLSDLLEIAEQFGIDLQELLFGNPEGAPLRQLDEQMQQAVQELPQVDGNDHVCVTGLNPYGVCGSAQCCDQPYACCIACTNPCNGRCGYLPEAPQPAPVWHPYPDKKPEEGQKVLTLCHSKYNRANYAAYIYRAGNWYLTEMPDDGLMKADVRWWSAELPPEEK